MAALRSFFFGKETRNLNAVSKTILVGVNPSLKTNNDQHHHGIDPKIAPKPLTGRTAQELERPGKADTPPALPAEAHSTAPASGSHPEATDESGLQIDREKVIADFLNGRPDVVENEAVATFIKRITRDLCNRPEFDSSQVSHIEGAAREALDFYVDLKASSRMNPGDFKQLVVKELGYPDYEDHHVMDVAGRNVIEHHLRSVLRCDDDESLLSRDRHPDLNDQELKAIAARVAKNFSEDWSGAKESKPVKISAYLRTIKKEQLPRAIEAEPAETIAQHLTSLLHDPASPLMLHKGLDEEERPEIAARVATDLANHWIVWARHLGCDEPLRISDYYEKLQDGGLSRAVDIAVDQHNRAAIEANMKQYLEAKQSRE